MPTGRKTGRIIREYKCRVSSSSAKLSNLNETGFSKNLESANGKNNGLSEPVKKILNQFVASFEFSLLPGMLYKAWPKLVHLMGLLVSSGKELLSKTGKSGIWR